MQGSGCYSFVYGGFEGNQNNFPTKIACKAACVDQGIPAVNKVVGRRDDPRIDQTQDDFKGNTKESRCQQVILFYI